MRYTGIDEVLEQGLHTWITDYILLVRQLANAIHSSYLGRMRLSITHDTTYRYEDRVRASIQYLRLTRRTASASTWSIGAWTCRARRGCCDPYGNILHVLTLDEPHESVLIAAHGLVEIDEEREVEHDRQSPLPFLRSTRLTGADAEMRAFAERAMGGRRIAAACST